MKKRYIVLAGKQLAAFFGGIIAGGVAAAAADIAITTMIANRKKAK